MADIFLGESENRNGGLLTGDVIFGRIGGNERISISSGVSNIRVDSAVEGVTFAGTPANFTFQREGNNLLVFSGATLVSRIIVDEVDGTVINFSNGSTVVTIGAAGMVLGGDTVSTTAGALTPDLEPIDSTPQLTAALEDLTDAQAALSASVVAAAAADADTPPADDPGYDAAIAAYTAADAQAELTTAQSDLFTAESNLLAAQQALTAARNTTSDAALQANLTAALAAVSDPTAQADLAARNEASEDLAADIAADGSNTELLTDLRAAIGAYVTAGGDTSVQVDTVGPVTIADLLVSINTVLATDTDPADDAGLVATIGGYTGLAVDLTGTAGDALEAAVAQVEERDALTDAAGAAQATFEANADLDAVQTAEEAIATREGLIEDVADAQAAQAAAQAYFDDFTALTAAITAAQGDVTAATDAFADLGFETPVTVSGAVLATAGDDIFVSGDTDGQITSFSTLGDDVLYVGQDVTLVELTDEVVGTDAVGSATRLEVFIQQDGADTNIYIEDQAFQGNDTDTVFNGTVITLVNVDAADVSFANGYFSIA